MRERLGGQRAFQSEFAATHFAFAFAQFVFVKRHDYFKLRIVVKMSIARSLEIIAEKEAVHDGLAINSG